VARKTPQYQPASASRAKVLAIIAPLVDPA
jgi:hypothetical protein